jgi:hypothetical protein
MLAPQSMVGECGNLNRLTMRCGASWQLRDYPSGTPLLSRQSWVVLVLDYYGYYSSSICATSPSQSSHNREQSAVLTMQFILHTVPRYRVDYNRIGILSNYRII